MRCQVTLLDLLDDGLGYGLELVGRCVLDARRVADEKVVRGGVGVDVAVPQDPIPFGAVHVLLHADLHPPITAFCDPKSPVACDARNTVDASAEESLEVALVP